MDHIAVETYFLTAAILLICMWSKQFSLSIEDMHRNKLDHL